MSPTTLKSLDDWKVVAAVGAVGFVFFTVSALVLSVFASTPTAQAPVALGIRFVLCVVVALVLLLAERRRERPSIDLATLEGIQVAAVVIIAESLSGGGETGARLAIRTATILIGLPLLSILTHVISQRIPVRNAADV